MRRRCLWLAVVFSVSLADVSAPAQSPGHGFHPPMPDQKLYFRCQRDQADQLLAAEVEIALPMAGAPTDLDQTVVLPAPWPTIHLQRYLPQAVLEQSVVPDPNGGGPPAVEISIEGPTQSYQRWLVADDPARNRLLSFIGTWRYMAVGDRSQSDELFRSFETELTRPPKLLIQDPATKQTVELAARPDAVRTLTNPACTIKVRQFFPHFGLDKETAQPVNQSAELVNPAALVEVEHLGVRVERWVFAKFPDFNMGNSSALPVQITLDCPLARRATAPDFMVLTIGRTAHQVWTRYGGKTSTRPLSMNQRIEVPGSQYTFAVAQFIPSGRLLEEYRPTQRKGATSALRIQTTGASGKESAVWLELGKARVIPTGAGPVSVVFGPRRAGAAGGHQ